MLPSTLGPDMFFILKMQVYDVQADGIDDLEHGSQHGC